MFNPTRYENSRPDGVGVLEVEDRRGLDRSFVPLRLSTIAGSVFGPLATLTITHTFRFSKAQFPHAIEARYRFPLPGDAAVLGVKVTFDGVEITATLAEREEAEATYRQAKAEGRQATLVTREAPDVFTLAVTGIEPDTDVVVETAYVQLAKPDGAGWSMRVPLTTAPRYVRADEEAGRHAQGNPLVSLRDPGHRATLRLGMHGAASVTGSMPLAVEAVDGGLIARLDGEPVLPDRDLVLRWAPAMEAARVAASTIAYSDPADGHSYFLSCITPPSGEAAPRQPREVIVLVDCSGSMSGAKWDAATWAVRSFLGGLDPRDRFALGFFENTVHWVKPQLAPADEASLAEALAVLARTSPDGGTEMGLALGAAYAVKPAAGIAAKHLLVVTDAEVSDGGRLLRRVAEQVDTPAGRRTSFICIDAAPNSQLINELTEAGRGTAHYLTSSPEEEDVATTLDAILEAWSAPIVTNLLLAVDRPDVESPGRHVRPYQGGSAIDLGDLPASQPRWVYGRVQGPLSTVQLSCETMVATPNLSALDDLAPTLSAASEILHAGPVVQVAGRFAPALKALFGAKKVTGLEYLVHGGHGSDAEGVGSGLRKLGYGDREVMAALGGLPLYPEERQAALSRTLKGFLVAESLRYGVLCAETAFVATRQERGHKIAATVEVANAFPAGHADGVDLGFGGGAPGGAMRMRSAMAPAPAAMPMMSAAPSFDLMEEEMEDCFNPPAPGGMPAAAPRPAAKKAASRGTGDLAGKAPSGGSPLGKLFGRRPSPAPAPASKASKAAAPDLAKRKEASGPAPLFRGQPSFQGREAVLVTSLPAGSISLLSLSFSGKAPAQLPASLAIEIYIDDMSAPRARVKLAELVKQGGKRPLSLRVGPRQAVKVVLVDPDGVWPSLGLPGFELSLT